MIEIIKTDNGYIIDNRFFFSDSEIKPEYINLLTYRGEDMEYGKKDYIKVSYPGEYDVADVSIKVYEGDSKKLNYIIKYEDKTTFFVQTPNILETQDIPTVHVWIYNDPHTEKVIEKLELEGEKYLLD